MKLEYQKILLPIDFSEHSLCALSYASEFARRFGASLTLVYVVEPAVFPPDFSLGQMAPPALNRQMRERSKDELESVARERVAEGVEFSTIVRTGKPFIEIIETARDENADLIIIPTHGRTGVEHIFFGSTAEKVVRKAPCPVLSLRKPIKGFDYRDAMGSERPTDPGFPKQNYDDGM
ncbi:MAG: universal stress protein [Ignavibacteriales bacterium]|nr:universal stress protein [Ignavibacteriales bacterium]